MSKLVGKFIVDQDRVYVIEELLPDGRVFVGKYYIDLSDDYAGVRYEGNVVLPIPDDRPVYSDEAEVVRYSITNALYACRRDGFEYPAETLKIIRGALKYFGDEVTF